MQEDRNYHRTEMQKELIIRKLKEQGCRITKQRRVLLDIILEQDCSCCKEIYYKASAKNERIGTATVYRMINKLEEIGAISRKNMYRIAGDAEHEPVYLYTVKLEDGTSVTLSDKSWRQVIGTGLKVCGYTEGQQISDIKKENELAFTKSES